MAKRPLIIAHRGASFYEKENTLEAFALAQKMGADAIEMDVWSTMDKFFIVQHSRSIGKGRGRKRVDKLNFAQAEQIDGNCLTLEKALDNLSNPKINLEIDLKNTGAEKELASLIKQKKISKITFKSNNGWQLVQLKKLLPSCKTILYYEPSDKRDVASRKWARMILFGISFVLSLPIKKILPRFFLGKVITFGADGVSLYHRFLNKKIVDDLHEEGIEVFVWGIDSERLAKRALAWNIDGIITKRPDVVKKLCK